MGVSFQTIPNRGTLKKRNTPIGLPCVFASRVLPAALSFGAPGGG